MTSATELTKQYTKAPTVQAREKLIYDHIKQGLSPSCVHNTTKITIVNKSDVLQLEVYQDYYSVGDDTDFLRIPLLPKTAQIVANMFDCCLPTRKIVNEIWNNATVKLAPKPYAPGPSDPSRSSTAAYVKNNEAIEAQLLKQGISGAPNFLIAGHKKDIVVCKALQRKKDKLFIYGWHELNGKPIQPLSDAHAGNYVDYSHGIRLIKNECVLNGTKTTVKEVLKSSQYCVLLSDEGTLTDPSY